MDMLPGSSYAWHLRESSNEPSCWWFVTQGLVLRILRASPTGEVTAARDKPPARAQEC